MLRFFLWLMLRFFLWAMVLLSMASTSMGDAVAGKEWILIDGYVPYWAPLAGGPAIPILSTSPAQNDFTSAASDGRNFLLAAGNSIYSLSEGSPALSLKTTPDPEGGDPRIVWNGTAYVTAWYRRREHVHGAVLDSEGTIVRRFDAPADIRGLHGLSSTGTGSLLLDVWTIVSSPARHTVIGALYDADFNFVRKLNITVLPRGANTSLQVMAIQPFAGGFYTVVRANSDSSSRLIGRQIGVSGVLGDERVLDANASEIVDVDLVPSGASLIAVIKRPGVGPVMGTFITAGGATSGPQPLGASIDIRRDLASPSETVRLPDGRLAIVSITGGWATVTPITDTPAPPARRRSVRSSGGT